MQRAGRQPDFYLCDPGVVDKYTQGLTVQERAGDVDRGAAAGNDLPLFATDEPAQPASQPASQPLRRGRRIYGVFADELARSE